MTPRPQPTKIGKLAKPGTPTSGTGGGGVRTERFPPHGRETIPSVAHHEPEHAPQGERSLFFTHWTRRKLLLAFLAAVALPAVTVGAYRVMRSGNASTAKSVLPAPDVVLDHVDPAAAEAVFDLSPRNGEHPFAPALRLARQSLEKIDTTVADYCCTFIKREQVGGKLQDQQTIHMLRASQSAQRLSVFC